MARQNHGPLSRAKGKLGGVVYQQYEGMQISREYQPVVKNPQTTKQTENRAKFKLSSQLVAEFKETLLARLTLLSIYNRIRRGAALNAIYNIVDMTDPANPQALVADVVAAINDKNVSGIAAPAITVSNNEFSVVATTGDEVIMVRCDYDEDGKLIAKVVEKYTSDGTAKASTPSADYYSTVLMAVALRPTTEEGRAVISNIGNTVGDFWMNTITRSATAGDIIITNLDGKFISQA